MAEKTEQVVLKNDVQSVIDELNDLQAGGSQSLYLLEIAKVVVLNRIIQRLDDLNANIDNYVAERIESDKVVTALLKKLTEDDPIDQEPEQPDAYSG